MKYVVDANGERHEVELDAGRVTVNGADVEARLAELTGTPVSVLTLGQTAHATRVHRREGRGSYTLWIDGYRFDVEALDERTRAIRDLDVARSVSTGPAPLLAPMPGLIVRVLVEEGQSVRSGEGLVVIEAMKMENELRAASAAKVKTIHALAGSPVEKGTLLIEMERVDE